MTDVYALQLQPGDVVGGYTLESRLGSGAMGSVWRAVDGGGNAYAMKILRASLSDSDDGNPDSPEYRAQMVARERLRREAVAMRKIRNSGVCQIVDMEIDDSLAFLVTELIEGENLREDVRHNGKYVGDDLERLSSKLIDAVHAVHEAGIVHRDIKPTNVMISVTGPVLVDFGIAMTPGESHVTSTGLVMGTPGFIAPEVIEGAESTAASDWWSLASVLAFAATGEPVFGTSPMMAVLQREASGHANLAGLPPHTLEAFRAALDPDPAQRCTPQELLEAIRTDAWTSDGEAMLPFDLRRIGRRETDAPGVSGSVLSTHERVENPRTLWHRQSLPTEAMPVNASTGTVPLPPMAQASHAANDNGDIVTPSFNDAESTGGTRVLPQQSFPRKWDSEHTATMPRPQPTTPLAATPPLEAATQSMRPMQSATGFQPVGPEANNAGASPNLDQPQYDAPNGAYAPQAPALPSDYGPVATAYQNTVRMHRTRGILPVLLATLPLMALAAACPMGAGIAASMLIWVELTLGMNLNTHVAHVLRRNGQEGSGSKVLRVAQLPWHAFAALFMSLWSLLLFWAIYMALMLAAIYLVRLPGAYYTLPPEPPWSRLDSVLLLAGSPTGINGLWLAISAAIAWAVTQFGPYSANLRAGAGVIVGLSPKQRLALRPDGNHRNIRRFIVLGIWVIMLALTIFNLEATPSIDWWPILPWSGF